MKKLIVGVKENDKMIFMQTQEVSDTYNSQELAKAIQDITKIFFEREK